MPGYPAWLSLTAIRDSQGQLSNDLAMLNDISERKKNGEPARHLASHDVLTDLPNRVLQQACRRAHLARCGPCLARGRESVAGAMPAQ